MGHSVDAGGARLTTPRGVSQCLVAVCCSMLQCVAAREDLLHEGSVQCVAAFTQYCSVLQCVAVWCSVVQHVAVCCSTLRLLA